MPATSTPPSAQPISFPTLVEIKSKLPKDCFVAETSVSIYYVLRSAFLIVSLWVAGVVLLSPESSYYVSNDLLRGILWCSYWHTMGILFWGVFVLGHDCGHGSFSRSALVNHVFGNLLHSFILVPYESWKVTHRLHHKNTGNIDKDEIFYPHRDDTQINWLKRVLVSTLGFAWMTYLYVFAKRHFWVFEDIFAKQRLVVLITHVWWVVAAAIVYKACTVFGLETVTYYYFLPLLDFMCWLVLTTFLHHQDEDAPWYGNEQWTYVKGNLSSIDRSYGFVVDNLIHSIGTHQIHHLFPKIPHYKLDRATEAFRAEFPQFVRKSEEPIFTAFARNAWNYITCGTVTNGEQYFSYRDAVRAKSKLN